MVETATTDGTRCLLIDGELVEAESGETFTTYDPATEEPIAEVAAGSEADVDFAVSSARNALDEWQALAPKERGRLLFDLSDAIEENLDELADLETRDSGKPRSEAMTDVEATARFFEYYAGIADKIQGESIPLGEDYVDFTIREPLGVTAQIVPWNFPIKLVGRSVAPALAAGNAAVVKPAEQTPLTALEVGKLALEVGIPPGVLNVVPGYGSEAGAPLTAHEDVDGVSFTGSVVTGQEVAKNAVENFTPVHLELGGKSPNVVFPDADLDAAVESTIDGIFTTQAGQVCSACSRLLLHEDIHDEFVEKLVARTRELTVGPGVEDPDVGPLISGDQFDRVTKYVELGREEAGECLLGGEALDGDGHFVAPTIFDGVENDMRIAQEEVFGPVLTVLTFESESEAFDLANSVDYGLVAGIFTSDNGRALRFAREAEAGQVFINEWFAGGPETPFGGYKQSGFGREKGLEAIRTYTQVKNVCANIAVGD